jgi:hypothetical protein
MCGCTRLGKRTTYSGEATDLSHLRAREPPAPRMYSVRERGRKPDGA